MIQVADSQLLALFARDVPTRYVASVDLYLTALPACSHRSFLDAELVTSLRRYRTRPNKHDAGDIIRELVARRQRTHPERRD